MITDFSTYTNAGLQNITYHNKNSLGDYGVMLAEGTSTSGLNIKSITEDISYRDGKIDTSDIKGLKYDSRTLMYRFKLFADDRATLKSKESEIISWLNSEGDKQILDSDYTETIEESTTVQWVFTNCNLKSIEISEGERNAECEFEYLTATFECDPYLIKQGGTNTRVIKLTDNIAINESAILSVTNNSCSITKSDGSTQSVTLPNTTRKYRLVVYSENVPTVTLNGTTLALDTVFTLPASATITIANAGYTYAELWNDTREVRL